MKNCYEELLVIYLHEGSTKIRLCMLSKTYIPVKLQTQ